MLVSSNAPYHVFISGRNVENALHHEDDSEGLVIGWVSIVKDTDKEITQAEYDALAIGIKEHNNAIPIVVDFAVINAARIEELEERIIDGSITPEESAELIRRERGLQERYERRHGL